MKYTLIEKKRWFTEYISQDGSKRYTAAVKLELYRLFNIIPIYQVFFVFLSYTSDNYKLVKDIGRRWTGEWSFISKEKADKTLTDCINYYTKEKLRINITKITKLNG